MARTCPHCGRTLGKGHAYGGHVNACLSNPALVATLRAFLDNGAGVCKTVRVYNATRPRTLPHPDTLEAQCGSWPAVAALCGLTPAPVGRPHRDGTPPQTSAARAAQLASSEVRALAVLDAPLAASATRGRVEGWRREGVAVCRVSYEDNREVRYMLR